MFSSAQIGPTGRYTNANGVEQGLNVVGDDMHDDDEISTAVGCQESCQDIAACVAWLILTNGACKEVEELKSLKWTKSPIMTTGIKGIPSPFPVHIKYPPCLWDTPHSWSSKLNLLITLMEQELVN